MLIPTPHDVIAVWAESRGLCLLVHLFSEFFSYIEKGESLAAYGYLLARLWIPTGVVQVLTYFERSEASYLDTVENPQQFQAGSIQLSPFQSISVRKNLNIF